MRLLIVTDTSGFMLGGVPAETCRLAAALIRNGHVVALAGDAVPAGLEPEKIRHFPIKLPTGPGLVDEIRLALADFEPDFIHLICMSSRGVMRLAPLLRDHRWVLTVHSLPPSERKLRGWHATERFHYGLRRLRFAANILAWRWVFLRGLVPSSIVHSRYVRDAIIAYGCPADAIKLIPLPFDPGSAQRQAAAKPVNADSPLLVTVGGLAHTKGQHDVIKALPVLLQRFRGLRYQVIGEIRDESYMSYLRGLARKLRVADHFVSTPSLDDAAKRAVLEKADVYIQPSHEEGFCLAYAEAAALVPRLVATDAGAMAAISEGDAGARVVPIRTPQAIARAVAQLMDVTLPPHFMSDRVARLGQRFSIADYLRSHEELYLSAAQDGAASCAATAAPAAR